MPIWCDMTCPDADWPQEEALDGSGSCRTFLAVYCKKYKKIHTKNAPCLDKTLAAPEPVKKARKGTMPPQKTAKK